MKARADKTLDKLAGVLKEIHPSRLEKLLDKKETVNIRVSETDKDTLKATSQALGLTLTDYLLRLHYFAVEALRNRKGK